MLPVHCHSLKREKERKNTAQHNTGDKMCDEKSISIQVQQSKISMQNREDSTRSNANEREKNTQTIQDCVSGERKHLDTVRIQ